MQETKIRWAMASWNPVSGCSKVSDGCKYCYAMELSLRYGWTKKPWTIQNEADNVVIKPHKLHEPYKLGEPQRVFVNSMSDLFHRVIPDWYRAVVFCVMIDLPQHVFQVLTKRPEATIDWHVKYLDAINSEDFKRFRDTVKDKRVKKALECPPDSPWAENVWMGTSVEDGRVLHRIDELRQNQALTRFISAEPLLGPYGRDVDLTDIHWVIVGGESGKHMGKYEERDDNPRWMDMAWAREIRDLCVEQEVAFFYKQDSGHTTELRTHLIEPDGSKWKWEQYPRNLIDPVCLDDETRNWWDTLYAPAPNDAWGNTQPFFQPFPKPKGAHTITIYTARVDCDDPDVIDITVKSSSTAEGKALAPSWGMVTRFKNGELTEDQYTQMYLTILRNKYVENREAFQALLARDRVVLVCYCPAGDFCHRHLAVDVLEKIGFAEDVRVVRGGEIQKTQIETEQLTLF